MNTESDSSSPVTEYILSQNEEKQEKLFELQALIRKNVPEAKETIAWSMATYKLNGNLIHFAACKNHLGIYPGVSAMEKFKEEISKYKYSKGGFQIPYKEELPKKLLRDILKFRVKEQISKNK